MKADVERFDFAEPPPGHFWDVGNRNRGLVRQGHGRARHITEAWSRWKEKRDPPGMYEVWYRAFAANIEPPYPKGAGAREREEAIRSAAWRWYEARLELYNILCKLNPPREYWPVILTWSDQDWLDVHAFLVERADGLIFPQVLRG